MAGFVDPMGKVRGQYGNVHYTSEYRSPLGRITMASDGEGLTGLWFEGQKYFAATLRGKREERNLPVFEETRVWLDCYFGGREPGFIPALRLDGTPFRLAVWEVLREIPYGEVVTYKDVAGEIARRRGMRGMSAQAVGGAVGHNPVSIIVPCHRVVGSDGSLTGYAGGIDKKVQLLALEGVDAGWLSREKHGSSFKSGLK